MQVIAYFVPTGSLGSDKLDPMQSALSQYATANGWRGVSFTSDRDVLRHAINSQLSADDVLLIPTLADLSETPSMQQKGVQMLLARGASLHVLSLRGPIEQWLLPLREVWRACRPLEQKLDAALKREETREEEHAAERAAFEAETFARMAETFGVSNLKAKLKDSAEPPVPAPAPLSPGDALKHARCQRNLSQSAAADMAGISRSQYQKAEAGELSAAVIQQITDALGTAHDGAVSVRHFSGDGALNPAPSSAA